MVKASDIRDRESLLAWLEGKPREVSVWIAHRAAMRAAPVALSTPQFDDEYDPRVGLLALRCNLISAVARVLPIDKVRSLWGDVNASVTSVNNINYGGKFAKIGDAFEAARYALLGCLADEKDLAQSCAYAVDLAAQATVVFERGMWNEVASDARSWEIGSEGKLPLWSQRGIFDAGWSKAREILRDSGSGFWINWYEDALAGREPDWGRLREIALIPDDIWEQGAEAVNARIESLSRGRSGSDAEDLHSDSKNWAITDRLARNAKVVALQLDTLRTFVAEEIERMRGQNSLPGEEHEALSARLVNLALIVEAVDLMREAIEEDEAGASTALVVVEAKLPQIVEAAEEAVELGGEPQVSATIVTMAASIRALTEAGTPGREATAIALADFCVNAIKRVFKRG